MSKVLVIDDEPMISKMVSRMLKIKGYTAIVANSGSEALELVPQVPENSFVILDLTMPGLSGEETLIKLIEVRPDLKIIISSGFGSSLDTSHYTKLGAYGFLHKPFDMETLLNVLAT